MKHSLKNRRLQLVWQYNNIHLRSCFMVRGASVSWIVEWDAYRGMFDRD